MEHEVVASAREGDADAFAEVVDEFTPTVRAVAFGLCGVAELASDIAQEVFTTAFEKIGSLRDPAALPGWLVALTRSAARRARPRPERLDAPSRSPAVDEEVVGSDEARRVRAAVEALPPAQRLPIALHYFAGCPLSEIAELCDVPLSTVKKRMRSARARMRQMHTEPIAASATGQREREPTPPMRVFAAMRSGDTAAVAALLDASAELVDVREDWDADAGRRWGLPWTGDGGTPLLRAVERGDTTMVELLLARGADPDARCSCGGGEYPLWVAASQNDPVALDLLLDAGADFDRPAFSGLTPLDVAIIRRYDDIADRLRTAGARPSTQQPFGRAAFEGAATGIRAIDLWCPLPERGLVHMTPGYGLGAIVLIGELSRRSIASGRRVVWSGIASRPLDVGDVHHAAAESGLGDDVTVAVASSTAPTHRKAETLDIGIAAATGSDLLIVFTETGHLHLLDERLAILAARPGVTIVVAPMIDPPPAPAPGTGPYRAAITFDEQRAARRCYPAISSNSWSTVAPHALAELAAAAREHPTDALNEYLTQSFEVAEHVTAEPGDTTSLHELHAQVAAIVWKHDHPDQAGKTVVV